MPAAPSGSLAVQLKLNEIVAGLDGASDTQRALAQVGLTLGRPVLESAA
jgi:hypothetical protein